MDNGFFIFTPVVIQVEDYMKNPQTSSTILVIVPGGSDGKHEIRYDPPALFPERGKRVILLASSFGEFSNMGFAWKAQMSLDVLDDHVRVAPCGADQLVRCEGKGTPIAEIRAQMSDALTSGAQYAIPATRSP
jgi:hypothetical protein